MISQLARQRLIICKAQDYNSLPQASSKDSKTAFLVHSLITKLHKERPRFFLLKTQKQKPLKVIKRQHTIPVSGFYILT